jgi:hypothetical protein
MRIAHRRRRARIPPLKVHCMPLSSSRPRRDSETMPQASSQSPSRHTTQGETLRSSKRQHAALRLAA